jgi:hypothetical protein
MARPRLLRLLLLLLPLVALAPRNASAFGFTSVIALVVGDAATAFPGANVSVVEVDYTSGAVLDRYTVPNTEVPGNSNASAFVGALVLCGDQSCVSYVGESTTASGRAAGDVLIHRHRSVDTQLSTGHSVTTIPGANWGVGQVAKAACSMDGSGYWVIGGLPAVRYVPHGGTQAGVVVNEGFAAAGANLNGCQLMEASATAGLPKAMYFEGSQGNDGYVFSASNAAEDWTTTLTLPAAGSWKYFNGNSCVPLSWRNVRRAPNSDPH